MFILKIESQQHASHEVALTSRSRDDQPYKQAKMSKKNLDILLAKKLGVDSGHYYPGTSFFLKNTLVF